ncbi:hypothetical protein [Tritonibacter scottomollicae]|uniref:hypothetical protein n=1 Tax=Tritonibacter scottomollicae TaxID=483013 RepID=UPI003BAD5DB4
MSWGSFGWGGFSWGGSYSFGGKSLFGGGYSSWSNHGWTYDAWSGCGGKSKSWRDDDDDQDDGRSGWDFGWGHGRGRDRDEDRDDDQDDRDDDCDDDGGRGGRWGRWGRDRDDDDRGGRGHRWWDRDDDDRCGRDEDEDDEDEDDDDDTPLPPTDGGDDDDDNGDGDGDGDTGGDDGGTDGKTTIDFTLGNSQQLTFEVSQTEQGTLFFKVVPTSWDSEETDIDGIFMNLTDDATANGLNIHPDENAIPLTNQEIAPNGVNSLEDGTTLSENFDIGLQFGQEPNSTDGFVDNLSFTLWSDNGPLSLEDVDLNNIALVTGLDNDDPQVIVGGLAGDVTDTVTTTLDDVLSLMNQEIPEDEETLDDAEEDALMDVA